MADPSTLVDRVKVFTTSSGTGPFTLGAAAEAFRGVEALTGGLIYSYAAENGADFEVGQGQYVAETTQLIRTPFESSLGAGALVPFPANTPVAFTALASDLSGTGSATAAAASANAAAASAGVATAAEEAAALSAAASEASRLASEAAAADAQDDADAANASAIAAAAAAAGVGVPGYANTLGFPGQGDRSALAVVSDLGTNAFVTGTKQADWSKLIDGTLAGKTPLLYIRAGAVTGKIIGVFPKPAQLAWFKVGKLRIRQANTVNNGTWEPVIFRGVVFDAAGNAISAAQVIPVGPPVLWNVATLEFPPTTSPTLPCEGYGWRATSGTAAGTGVSTGLFQFEAETLTTDSYGRRVLPPTALARQTARISGGTQTILVDPNEPALPASVTNLWMCDEGHGLTVADQIGGADFTLVPTANRCDIAVGGSVGWEDGELTLRNASLATAATVPIKNYFFVYESVPDAAQYVCNHANQSLFLATARQPTNASKLKMMHGFGIRNAAINGNNVMFGFASGGTSMAWVTRTALATGAVILNATRNTDWAGRIASPLKICMIIGTTTDASLSDAQAIQEFADWHMARRGRVLTGKYAAKRCAVALWTGESTHHTSLVMDLDPTLSIKPELRKNFYNSFLMAMMGPAAVGAPPALQRLSYWMDALGLGYQLGNESRPGTTSGDYDRNRKMGPLIGFAETERHGGTPNEYPIFHFKVAQGGTLIAPFGSALAAGGTLGLTDTFDAGVTTGATLFTSLEAQGWSKMEAELRRQGYGIDYVTRYDARGINDSFRLAASVINADPTIPQGWLQTEHDRLKGFMGLTYLKTYTLVPHLPIPGAPETYADQCGQPGVTGYANDAAGRVQFDNLLYIRTGVRAFATASAGSEVTSVEGDLYGTNILNGDSVHMPLGTIPGINGANFIATTVAASAVITVTSVQSGALAVGMPIFGANIPEGTTISSFGTGTGGTGTYTLSAVVPSANLGAAMSSGLRGQYGYGGDCRRRYSFAAKVAKLYDAS